MKAFILAAGEGTRLRPLTDSVPKCLLPIQGVPLLEIWLKNCEAAGIGEVLVNAHAHPDAIREFVAKRKTGVKVRIAEEPQLLGSAGTLAENREFVAGEQAFFVLYGDVLTNLNLRPMLAFHEEKRVPATLIFVPSRDGLSHNAREFTEPAALDKGLAVLTETLWRMVTAP
ncbi:MAG: sugar phosphate nucleotidyltransferase [Terriglobales bacterium]